MGFQIRPAPHQIPDLKRIVALGPVRLNSVHARLVELSGIIPDPAVMLRATKEVVEGSDAEALIRQLLSLRGIARQSGQPIEAIVAGLGEALANESEGTRIDPPDWQLVRVQLASLLELESVRLATTAIELSYDYANLLQRTKILTDIRPIFNDAADTITGAVVSFTLRLRYTNADGERDLSIALDESDIRILADQCDRAITKAGAARSQMSGKCGVPVAIFGEVENA
jgi:hypothetical protein